MSDKTETFEFQAETKRLLNIVIHSLYTEKEIFLRELISNASDALDRLRFEALTHPDLMSEDEKLEIRLEADPKARTLTIHDNGIGMTRAELVKNLGTIAQSGTMQAAKKLKKAASADQAAQLIGQFGVGFYSAFMAAKQVKVVSKRAGKATALRWVSKADGKYSVEKTRKEGRGTSVTLYLKPVDTDAGLEDFTDRYVLTRLVKRHSDFVSYPILLETVGEPPDEEADDDAKEEAKPLNSMKPLWVRPESEVSEEDYAEFYRHLSHDWEKPLKNWRYRAEGLVEYQALIFVPSKAPMDFLYHNAEFGLQLYARRVKIMERCEELLPRHLRFVKGVVDASDLPLNISRQRLQNDRHIRQIRKWISKKILDSLAKMQQEEPDQYLTFWKEFGGALKEGVSSDPSTREKLTPVLLFASSHHDEELTTLKDYVGRMPEDQKEIYYLSGESRARLEQSPHLEAFKDKGYEVLYMTEPVDEFMLSSLVDFEGKTLRSAAKGRLEWNEEAQKVLEEEEKSFQGLKEHLQKALEDQIKEVRLSARLTDSPVCLVGDEHDPSPHLERLMRRTMSDMPSSKKIMELNPKHPIVAGLQKRFEKDAKDPRLDDFAHLLLGYGFLAEGGELPDPGRFNRILAELMAEGAAL